MRHRRVACAATLAGFLTALTVAASAQAANGTWERTWGKNVSASGGAGFLEVCVVSADCQAGGNGTAFGGELNFPRAIAADAAGNVYVADTNNNRIQKFDSAGNFLLAWGKNVSIGGGSGFLEVCTVAIDCKAGEETTKQGGELDHPAGIATDPAGNVYVADTGNERLQRFDGNGNFQRAWGADVSISSMTNEHEICTVATDCKVGVADSEGGEFSSPEGLAADNTAVYVADESNDRVQRFTPNGAFVLTWGDNVTTGAPFSFEVCSVAADCRFGDTGPPQLGGDLDDPAAVAIDPSGRVLVADSSHDRMQRYDSAGNWQVVFGRDVVSAGPGNTGTEFEICSAAAGDTCKIGSTTTAFGGNFDFPTGVATDATGAIYVADSQNTRVQKLGAGLNFISAWGKDVSVSGGTGNYEVCTVATDCQAGPFPPATHFGGEFHDPGAIASTAGGTVYELDALDHRVQRFADPVAAPVIPPAAVTPVTPVTTATETGQRAAALKKCKKKKKKQARKKCNKKAKKLPV